MSRPIQNNTSQHIAIIAFSLGSIYFAYAFIHRVAPSIMTDELMRDFRVGAAALGAFSAFYFWTYAALQLPVGILTDRYGPRRLMSLALAICAIATVGFAMSNSLPMASFWRAIIGGTVAFAFVGTLAIAGGWFKHSRQAMLAGILQSVGMLGAILAQAPLRLVVENIGWRNTTYFLAAAGLILAILLYTLVPRRTNTSANNQPDTTSKAQFLTGLRSVTTNPQSWLCALIGFGMYAALLAFSGLWAVPWLSTIHGYSPTQAAGIASALFLGSAVFAPLVGWISDRVGRRNILVQVGTALYIATFSIVIFHTPESATGLTVLLFITGGFSSTATVCLVASKEHNDPAFASTAVSLMNVFIIGSGAVMQPLIGWLLDLNWTGTLVDGVRVYDAHAWKIGFSSLLLVMCAAQAGTFLLRETYCKPAYKPKDSSPSFSP